jgi:hypothetical protein
MIERPNKYLRGLTTAFALGTVGAGIETLRQESPGAVISIPEENVSEQGEVRRFRDNPEFAREVLSGEFSPEERASRTEEVMPGIEIFHDIGRNFYRVQIDDTKESIGNLLSLFPEYAYLDKQKKRTVGFNIDEKFLHDVEWLPIPLCNQDRMISDEDFLIEAKQAIDELIVDEKYGEMAQKMIDKIGEERFGATVLAIAKMESGEHIGSSEFSLYDATNKTFSVSPFHILLKGAGERARRNLNKTVGQMNSPKNAVKFVVAFMVEKMGDPTAILPLDQHYEQFATQYNGANWRKMNPNYATDLEGYYTKALKEAGVK